MTVPICPNHPQGPKPMQMGKFGKWFCPNKVTDPQTGAQTWCKSPGASSVSVTQSATYGQPAPYAQPATPVAPAAPPVAVQEQSNGDYVALAVASLGMAQAVYQGFGPEKKDEIIQYAQNVMAAMKVLCR